MRYIIGLLFLSIIACHAPRPVSSVAFKDYVVGKGVKPDEGYEKMLSSVIKTIYLIRLQHKVDHS